MNAAEQGAEDEGLTASFAKAEAREPVWGLAQGFVPPSARPSFRAWAALLGEVRECAFELSDPRVTALKAGWWAEEFDGLARGAARHPVSRVLVRHRLPWQGLSDALLAVASDTDPPSDPEAALASLLPLGRAVATVELALNGGAAPVDASARALAAHWLRHRLERGLEAIDRGRVPLSLFARHGLRRDQLTTPDAAGLRRDWAAFLAAALPASNRSWPYARRIALAVDAHALAALSQGRPVAAYGGFGAVWRCWRLARNAAFQPQPTATPTT